MDHTLYSAEDFAADESFIAYHLKNDEESLRYWTSWLLNHPEKAAEVLAAKQLLDLMVLKPSVHQREAAFQRFDEFLVSHPHTGGLTPDSAGQATTRKLFSFRTAAIAASLFLMLAAGLLYFKAPQRHATQTEFVTIRNDYGKISTISLADGTTVSLNANSKLSYPKHFEADRREVRLEGEAFFEVAKDKSRPFTVSANGTKTRVFGTKFNVNAYQKQTTEVALLEGSVAFASGKIYQLLKPSEKIVYRRGDAHVRLSAFNTEEVTGWTRGMIVFKQASFGKIAGTFKNLYGIELQDHTGKESWTYTGSFSKSDYITIVQSICFAKNLTYHQNQHTIIFTTK